MKSWWYLALVRVNKQITWWNKCVQHVIWVEEVWEIGCYEGLWNTLVINTQDEVCCFQNISLSRISSLVSYWAENNILAGVNLIHSGTNLKFIPKISLWHFQFIWGTIMSNVGERENFPAYSVGLDIRKVVYFMEVNKETLCIEIYYSI